MWAASYNGLTIRSDCPFTARDKVLEHVNMAKEIHCPVTLKDETEYQFKAAMGKLLGFRLYVLDNMVQPIGVSPQNLDDDSKEVYEQIAFSQVARLWEGYLNKTFLTTYEVQLDGINSQGTE